MYGYRRSGLHAKTTTYAGHRLIVTSKTSSPASKLPRNAMHLLRPLPFISISMQHSPWEANRFSSSQEIPQIWWNLKVHYSTYKCSPPVPTLSQIKLIHAPHSTSWRSILILSSHLRLGFPSGILPSAFSTKTLYTPFLSPMCATFPSTSLFSIWSPKWYLVRSWDHEALHYLVFSIPMLPHPSWAQIFSSATYSQTLAAYVPPSMWATKFHTHTKQQAQL